MTKSINIETLQSTKHMFEWLAENPFEIMINDIESMLSEQVNGAQVSHFDAIGEPQWLTGGTPSEQDETKMILVRTGVALEFKLTVIANGSAEELKGIYTWVRKKVEEEFHSQTWFDINGTLAEFGSEGTLKERIY